MPEISINSAVYSAASAVLDELGLDVTAAVNVFLKTVIREGAIPFELKLSHPVSSSPVMQKDGNQTAPASSETQINNPHLSKRQKRKYKKIEFDPNDVKEAQDSYIDYICQVPFGSLTRWCDLPKPEGSVDRDLPNYRVIKTWPERLSDGTEIPYWRVLNYYGIVAGNQTCTKAQQQEKLTAEGHQIISAKHAKHSVLKVADYQKKLFSFTNVGKQNTSQL